MDICAVKIATAAVALVAFTLFSHFFPVCVQCEFVCFSVTHWVFHIFVIKMGAFLVGRDNQGLTCFRCKAKYYDCYNDTNLSSCSPEHKLMWECTFPMLRSLYYSTA